MPGMKKSINKKESPSSSYKDSMMKLKNYWPESTINLYLTKAISLHDLDSYVVSDEQMSDIHKVVLNMDEWYKKNPEYSFMTATKLLKEKAQIHMSMPDHRASENGESPISRYFRSESPYRSRTRYERAVEEDQYSRRPIQSEDMSDEEFLASLDGQEVQGVNIPMPQDSEAPIMRSPSRTNTVRISTPQNEPVSRADQWSHLFGNTYSAPIVTTTVDIESSLSDVTVESIQDVPSGHLMTGAVSDGILLHTPLGHIDGTVTDLALPVENFIQNEDGTWTRR